MTLCKTSLPAAATYLDKLPANEVDSSDGFKVLVSYDIHEDTSALIDMTRADASGGGYDNIDHNCRKRIQL